MDDTFAHSLVASLIALSGQALAFYTVQLKLCRFIYYGSPHLMQRPEADERQMAV
jgi:hypothetical protein